MTIIVEGAEIDLVTNPSPEQVADVVVRVGQGEEGELGGGAGTWRSWAGAWVNGYRGEQVGYERALERGLRARLDAGEEGVRVAPPMVDEQTFPRWPAALITLNTLVRWAREEGLAGPVRVVVDESQRALWEEALVEVRATMVGA